MVSIFFSIIIAFFAILTFSNHSVESVLAYSIITKVLLIIFYLLKNKLFKISVFTPNNLFIIIYFIFVTFGEAVWLFREQFLYNLPGNPIKVTYELLSIYIFLVYVNLYINSRLFLNEAKSIIYNYKLSKQGVFILSFMGIIGLLIFTKGLTNIPIFRPNIEEGRKIVSETSGLGIAFVLIVSILYLFIFSALKYIERKRAKYLILCCMYYFPFILYGGRSLFILPFFMFFSIYYSTKIFNVKKYLLFISIITTAFLLSSIYSLYRSFGYIDLNSPMQYNYLFGDLFPEFRTLVNTKEISIINNYGNSFFGNLFYGQVPGFVFDLLGLSKNDYFISIGKTVTSHTSYAEHFEGGIRLSLIGELLISSPLIKYISLGLIQLILTCGTYSIYNQKIKRNSISLLILSYYIVFSFPYGLNFIMNSIQLFVILVVLNKYIFKFNPNKPFFNAL